MSKVPKLGISREGIRILSIILVAVSDAAEFVIHEGYKTRNLKGQKT